MKQQTLSVNENTTLILRSHGGLRLTGWDRPDVSIDGDPSRIEQSPDELRITCLADCELFLPMDMLVVIEKVGSDARLANLSKKVSIEKIGGDLTMAQMGEIQLQHVGGNCRISSASGQVLIEKVSGDFQGSGLLQRLVVDKIGGDMRASVAQGGASARAGGNIRLALQSLETGEVQLRAGGDLALYLPTGVQGTFQLESGGEDIRIQLGEHSERVNSRAYQFTLGQGGTVFTLRAGGSIRLTDQPFSEDFQSGLEGLEERITSRIRTSLEASQLSRDISERTNRLVSDAMKRAQERVQAAIQRLDQPFPQDITPAPPRAAAPATPAQPSPAVENPVENPMETKVEDELGPAQDGVSDEERLLILRMLQEKKITVEQAEELIEALEVQEGPED